jgi:DNA-binding response OmpR family regulator
LKSKSTEHGPDPVADQHSGSIVYVVDDDLSVREALGNLLRSVGLKAVLFHSAQDFMRQRRPADVPACLVLDVRLPGQSGLELQAELTRSGDRIPIIFITGHGDVPMSVRAMKGGAVEFLQKPFREQDLLDAIHLALMRNPGSQPAPAAPVAGTDTGAAHDDAGPREMLAKNIQMGRAIFSWSQEELGAHCELHRTHISALERKELNVGVDTVDRVAAAFGVPPYVMLTRPLHAQTLLLQAFNASGSKGRRGSRH